VFVLVLTCAASDTKPNYALQIVASPLGKQGGDSAWSPGHTFMIIKDFTRTGVKEEAFGFNAKPIDQGQGKEPREATKFELIVGTPGAPQSEFRLHPERCAKITESVEIPITFEQKRAIYQEMARWDHESHPTTYEVMFQNCMDFIERVVRVLGIPADNHHPLLPATYVHLLKERYDQKVAKDEEIEAARQREEAEREREQQAQQMQQQQKRPAPVQPQ
jgi:hypothetical protein